MSTKPQSGAGSEAIEARHRALTRSLTVERFAGSDQAEDQHATAGMVTGVHQRSIPDSTPTRVSRRKYRGWTLASRRYR